MEKPKYGTLIRVEETGNESKGVVVCPIFFDTESIGKEDLITDGDLLKDVIYGLSSLVRTIEKDNPDLVGEVMTNTIKSLENLYINPNMQPLADEKLQRYFNFSDKSGTEEITGDDCIGGNFMD